MNIVAAVSNSVTAGPGNGEPQGAEHDPVAYVLQTPEYEHVEHSSCPSFSPMSYEPFLSMGSIKLNGNGYPVKVLHDTGATRTLLRNPNPGKCLTDRYVALTGGGGLFSASSPMSYEPFLSMGSIKLNGNG